MKTILLLLAALAITGCSVDNSSLTVHNYTEDQTSPNGLVLKAPSTEMYVSFEEVVQLYEDTMACMGLGDNGVQPTVQFANKIAGSTPFSNWGNYLVVADLVTINNDMEAPFVRDKAQDQQTLKHEFIHHILHKNGMSGHPAEFFEPCAGGVGINVHS